MDGVGGGGITGSHPVLTMERFHHQYRTVTELPLFCRYNNEKKEFIIGTIGQLSRGGVRILRVAVTYEIYLP